MQSTLDLLPNSDAKLPPISSLLQPTKPTRGYVIAKPKPEPRFVWDQDQESYRYEA